MFEKVFPILKKYIRPGSTVIAGISGGPDSTALLKCLHAFSVETPCRIIVAHVNHGIRGREALADELFVKKMTEELGLVYEIKRVELSGAGLEERGRIIRREFFEHLLKKYNAEFIITAHTKDDQAETIIFNFLRGSGPAGLAGMEMLNGVYLKPFLGISKPEILRYLKENKIKFCSDRTNDDTNFSRNFIRKKILPLCEELNPSFKETVVRNAEIFKALHKSLEKEGEAFLKKQKFAAQFSAKDFLELPEAVQNIVLELAFRKFTRQHHRIPSIKIGEIKRMIKRNIGKKKIMAGSGVWFALDKNKVSLVDF